jgi:endonuclease G, mitochondrial
MKSAKPIVSIFLIVAIVTVFLYKKINANYFNNNVLQQENNDSNSTANTLEENKNDINQTFNFLPTSTTNQIVKHQYYTLSYNEKYEQAEWVAYELKKSFATKNHFQRPFFIEDPEVSTGSADWKNYKNSGYDKGHLCPAGDMSFDKNAYDDTFFTSNISPQLHDFNDGVWNRLEQKTRYWATKYDGIFVVTGGVLQPNLETIGKENVAVPKYFYKVLLDNSNGEYKMIAFLVPSTDSEKPLYSFVTSVDAIEKMTGIDFFPKLDDKIENSLEKNADYKAWSF